MNHSDDDSVSPPDPTHMEPTTFETPDVSTAPETSTTPAADPAPVAAKPSPSRWRKWLLYVFATLGALALVLIVVIAIAIARDKKTTAPTLSRDAVVDESMTRNYGKYSESAQGWLYVDPATKSPYVMQVLQRAQVDVPSETMTGVTAVYFLVSGTSTESANKTSLLGMFRIQPDIAAHDGTLTETALPVREVLSDTPVTAQDVHFEALSKDTWGWVVKMRRNVPDQPAVRIVDNVVFAPHDGQIATLATFPASGLFTAADGCERAQAVRDGPAEGQEAPATEVQLAASGTAPASAASSAAAPASASASEPDSEHEGDDEGEEQSVPYGCFDASWTYGTGDVPADGFVTISVKGGGTVNGAEIPVKTYKLVFDPKSFTYVLPQDMPTF